MEREEGDSARDARKPKTCIRPWGYPPARGDYIKGGRQRKVCMSSRSEAGKPRGWDLLESLVEDGYRVVDVDSNELFVGVRLRRADERRTVLLTTEDFRALFPLQ